MASSTAILNSDTLQSQLKKHRIQPYRVEESGLSLHTCIRQVNSNNFQGYGADYTQGSGANKIVVGCLQQYYELIKALASNPRIRFAPHCDLRDQTIGSDEIICSIRHDVDADPRVSLAEAEIEAEFNASTTYFMLHTAPYYGTFHKGVFRRNSCMAVLYRQIQDLGQEIALHTDPLELFQNLKINGAEAVVTEIEWLRSQGIRIVGSVAHNSAPIYGIENYAIFQGRNKHNIGLESKSEVESALLEEVIHEGRWAPLGIIDEQQLGLQYEGNEFFHQRDVRVEYGATRGVNRWRWNQHNRRLKEHPDPREDLFIDQTRLLRDIQSIPGGCWLILNVHPLYYGARHNTTTAPPMHIDSISIETNALKGWDTYQPNTLQASSGNNHDAQVINFSDEFGMLDAPCPCPNDNKALNIMFLGGKNLDGCRTPIPEHCGQQLQRLLTRQLDRPVWCRTLAFPSMGLSRHFDWFVQHQPTIKPHIVFIGIGADEFATSLLPYWSLQSGFDQTYPPARYLNATSQGAEIVPASPMQAAIRRSRSQSPSVASLTDETVTTHTKELEQLSKCLHYYVSTIREAQAIPLLFINECGESVGSWSNDADPEFQRAGHTRALLHIKELANQSDLEIIDPYQAFLDSENQLPCHVADGSQWNATGHRLAARAAFDAVTATLTSKS